VESDGGWAGVAGAGGLAGFLDAVGVVAGSLTARGLVRCRRDGLVLPVMVVARTAGIASVHFGGGNIGALVTERFPTKETGPVTDQRRCATG
jgi:hypothetical protein